MKHETPVANWPRHIASTTVIPNQNSDLYDKTGMEPLRLEHTERGFGVMWFHDRYHQICSLQQSSLATENAIWLGVSVDLKGRDTDARMHLTQAQLKVLLPALQHFAETGKLTAETPAPRSQKDLVLEWYTLPQNTRLGRLEMLEVYDWHDRPCLFSCRNEYDVHFLVLLIREDGAGSAWLFCPMSAERLGSIERDEIDLRSAFLQHGQQDEFRDDIYLVTEETGKLRVEVQNLKFYGPRRLEDWMMPRSGEYLKDRKRTV